jgi:hypothetical protein
MTKLKIAAAALLLVLTGFAATLMMVQAVRPDPIDDWTVEDLVMHLRHSGMELRAVSTYKNGRIGPSAYLTTTNKSWEELNALAACSDRVKGWEGTVYCCRTLGKSNADPRLQLWGEFGMRRGSFVFFGDAALIARIDAAMRDATSLPGPAD